MSLSSVQDCQMYFVMSMDQGEPSMDLWIHVNASSLF